MVLNVNVPPGKPKGVKITRLGVRQYTNVFSKRVDPRGGEYYWMAGTPHDVNGDEPGVDLWAISNGYISITPLQYDLTDNQGAAVIESLLKDFEP
jgi:5'-nucleotidase